jgi:hypothetical protein
MSRPTLREQARTASLYHLQRLAADLLAEGQSMEAVAVHLWPLFREEQARLATMAPALDSAERLLALIEHSQHPPAKPKPPCGLKRGSSTGGGSGGGRRGRGGRGRGLE